MNRTRLLRTTADCLPGSPVMFGEGAAPWLRMSRVVYAPEGGGSGGGDGEVDLADPRVKKAVEEAVAEATRGLKANRDEALKEKKEAQERQRAADERLSGMLEALGGEDGVKHLKEMRDRFMGDETNKLLAEGKHEEWFERRSEAMRKAHTKEMEARDKRIADLDGEKGKLVGDIRERDIRDAVTEACREARVSPDYQDAVSLLVRQRLRYDDESNSLIVVDSVGDPALGPKGKPMTVLEAVDAMRESRPKLFEQSSGGGAAGGNRAGGGAETNPWKPETRNLTQQGLMIRDEPEKAKRMKAEAGIKS